MQRDAGNVNILFVDSLQKKTGAETTQQIAVPYDFPLISGKRQPPKDIDICMYIYIYHII